MSGLATCEILRRAGTPFAATAQAAEHVAEAVRAADGAAGGAVASVAGTSRWSTSGAWRRSRFASVNVKFKPVADRAVSVADFGRLWRQAAGQVPGVETFAIREWPADRSGRQSSLRPWSPTR